MNDPKATAWLTKVGGLAKRLEKARLDSDRSGLSLAGELGWASSKITRIEQGTQVPTPKDIDDWAAACNLGGAETQELHRLLDEFRSVRSVMRQRGRKEVTPQRGDASALVEAATLIRTYSAWAVPPILQMEEYAVGVLNEQGSLNPAASVDPLDALDTRMQRQRLLSDRTREFQFLVDEGVLYRRHGGAEALRDQLQFLLRLKQGQIGIVPFAIDPALPAGQSVAMYDDQVFVEQISGDEPASATDAELFTRLLEQLWRIAATGPAAKRLIEKAIDDLDG